MVTWQGSWNDVWGTAMMFLPVGQGKRDVENNFRSAADDAADGPVRDAEPTRADEGETTTKSDEAETSKSDDPETTKAGEEEGNTTRNTESESPTKPDKDGEAYEEGDNQSIKDLDEASNEMLALPPPRNTSLTLKQVRRLRGRQKWEAGETYVQELYGSEGQQHYKVPA